MSGNEKLRLLSSAAVPATSLYDGHCRSLSLSDSTTYAARRLFGFDFNVVLPNDDCVIEKNSNRQTRHSSAGRAITY